MRFSKMARDHTSPFFKTECKTKLHFAKLTVCVSPQALSHFSSVFSRYRTPHVFKCFPISDIYNNLVCKSNVVAMIVT